MFVVRPFAGLANRLRAIDSAVGIARHGNRDVTLVWNRNIECNCPFRELFVLPSFMQLKEVSSWFQDNGRVDLLKRKMFYSVGMTIPFGFDKIMFDRDILEAKKNNYNFLQLLDYKKVFFNSTTRFYMPEKPYEYLKPTDEIIGQVEQFMAQAGPHIMGLHIRRTDNNKSIKYSPTELFEEKMDQEIHNTPDLMFFLATDSAEDERRLLSKYKDRVLVRPKKLDRNNPEAIKDALVDMLCLARTQKIYGSYWSSFSETAADFGNIQLERLTNTQFNAAL